MNKIFHLTAETKLFSAIIILILGLFMTGNYDFELIGWSEVLLIFVMNLK